jgi:cytochrome-b5 reductase
MSSPLSSKYVLGIYLPSAVLLIGTAAVKSEWLPYALALTAVLTGAVIFSSQGTLNKPPKPWIATDKIRRSQGAEAGRLPGV